MNGKRKHKSTRAIREYVGHNPLKWAEDDENPDMERGRP